MPVICQSRCWLCHFVMIVVTSGFAIERAAASDAPPRVIG
jgi:hypothetical protein